MVPQTEEGLQVSVEEVAAWARKLVITVPAPRVRAHRAHVARKISKKVQIPGFRKGKVPAKQLEARFGQDIDRRTLQNLIDDTFREAIRQEGLEPINAPQIANVHYDPDSDLTFEVRFDIWPEISLDRIGGFRISKPKVEVSDDEVRERLDALRREQAIWQPVDRRPSTGDNVLVEIVPLDEIVPGEDDGDDDEARSYRFVLGEGRAIPDVESAIMTLEPGGSGEFTVQFPEDFPDDDRRGETQRLRIELQQVTEPTYPEPDDEFARSVGDFESMDELRQAVSDQIRNQKDEETSHHVEHQIIDQVIAANPFEVPESMVDRYLDAMIRAPEDADPEKVREAKRQAHGAAVRGIKRMLILRHVAKEQGLEATGEEIDERLGSIAERADRPVREVRAQLARSGELDELERRITDEKALEYLKEQAEIETAG